MPSTTRDIWYSVASPEFPKATASEMQELKLHAASQWLMHTASLDGEEEPHLVKLFGQYIMLKNLTEAEYTD